MDYASKNNFIYDKRFSQEIFFLAKLEKKRFRRQKQI